MTSKQAAAIVSIWEHPDFINNVIPLIREREESLMESLLGEDDDKTRGRVMELRRIVALHDMAYDVLIAEQNKNDIDNQ